MVVPVGVFHDDLHLRVDGLCRVDHQFPTGIGHEAKAIVGPAFAALCGNLVVVLQVDEEEIVKNEVVEEPGRIFGNLFHLLPLLHACIAIGFEVGRLRAGVGDATAHLETFFPKELLHLRNGFFRNGESVAVSLNVDFVEINLAAYGLPR